MINPEQLPDQHYGYNFNPVIYQIQAVVDSKQLVLWLLLTQQLCASPDKKRQSFQSKVERGPKGRKPGPVSVSCMFFFSGK